jgi:hypothetical protein
MMFNLTRLLRSSYTKRSVQKAFPPYRETPVCLRPKMSSSFFGSATTEQKRKEPDYSPRPQPYWHHNGSSRVSSSKGLTLKLVSSNANVRVIRLVSWNIDFQRTIRRGTHGCCARLPLFSHHRRTTGNPTCLISTRDDCFESDANQGIKVAPGEVRHCGYREKQLECTNLRHDDIDRLSLENRKRVPRTLVK